jgi:hypothetical protein
VYLPLTEVLPDRLEQQNDTLPSDKLELGMLRILMRKEERN